MKTLQRIQVDDDSRYATNIAVVVGFSNATFQQCIFKKGDSPENVALMLKVLADNILHDDNLRS